MLSRIIRVRGRAPCFRALLAVSAPVSARSLLPGWSMLSLQGARMANEIFIRFRGIVGARCLVPSRSRALGSPPGTGPYRHDVRQHTLCCQPPANTPATSRSRTKVRPRHRGASSIGPRQHVPRLRRRCGRVLELGTPLSARHETGGSSQCLTWKGLLIGRQLGARVHCAGTRYLMENSHAHDTQSAGGGALQPLCAVCLTRSGS